MEIDEHNKRVHDIKDKVGGFVVIPQHGYGRLACTMDKTVVKEMYNLSAIYGQGMTDTVSADVAWNCFNTTHWRQKHQRLFSHVAHTDGVKLNIILDVPKRGAVAYDDHDVRSDYSFSDNDIDMDDEFERYVIDDDEPDRDFYREIITQGAEIDAFRANYLRGVYKRIMGIDWGFMFPIAYHCIDFDDGIDAETTAYLDPETYYESIKFKKHMKNIIAHTHKFRAQERTDQANIKRRLNCFPSNRSAEYIVYITHKLRNFAAGTATWQKREIARINFKRRQTKQRVLRMICNSISQGKRTIVYIGPNILKYRSPMKGYPRFPISDLIVAMQADPNIDVVIGDEYNTSQKCSLCWGQLIFPSDRSKKRNAFCGDCKPQNALLPIPNRQRKIKIIPGEIRPTKKFEPLINDRNLESTYWHRDGNAARNMSYLLLCILKGITPNEVFIRGGN